MFALLAGTGVMIPLIYRTLLKRDVLRFMRLPAAKV
jgi:hypothetical protein